MTRSSSSNSGSHLDDLADLAGDLCDRVLRAHREAQRAALARGRLRDLFASRGHGVGDETFALDEACEAAIDAWLTERAARAPLSVLTEDRGWRHVGPDAAGGVRELDGFDHGGPRLAIDPVDGTRNVAADLRPAWTVVGACGPGRAEPRAGDVVHGTVSELPLTRSASGARLTADAGRGAYLTSFRSDIDEPLGAIGEPSPVRVDADDTLRGYLPFFRYDVHARRAAVALESDVLRAFVDHEGASERHLFDDQYICSAGQLVLLALGTYRMVVDPRVFIAQVTNRPATTSKPYDLSGALIVAREAGCVLAPLEADRRPPSDGAPTPFDFPLDARTPVGFVGYHNPATARRCAPHLAHALARAASDLAASTSGAVDRTAPDSSTDTPS